MLKSISELCEIVNEAPDFSLLKSFVLVVCMQNSLILDSIRNKEQNRAVLWHTHGCFQH
jgi:hypothetical protein